jgi:hypothetical protein
MAQQDMQWPSEDEDFDTVTDAEELKKSFKNDNDDQQQNTDQASDNQPLSDEDEDHDSSQQPIDQAQGSVVEDSNTDGVDENSSDSEEYGEDFDSYQDDEPVVTDSNMSEQQPDEYIDNQPQEDNNQDHVNTSQDGASESQTETIKKPLFSKMRVPKPQFNPSKVVRFAIEGLLVILAIGLGLSVWVLKSDNNDLKQQVAQLNNNPELTVQKQTQQVINSVARLIQLPTGEVPTIANVTNANQAKQQSSFFSKAEDGDKVLMYVKAGEAILYRPSTNRIITVAPLTFDSTGSGTNSTSTAPTTTDKSTK